MTEQQQVEMEIRRTFRERGWQPLTSEQYKAITMAAIKASKRAQYFDPATTREKAR